MMLIKKCIAMLLTVANYFLNRERLEAVVLCRASPAVQKQCFVAADERKGPGLASGYLRLFHLIMGIHMSIHFRGFVLSIRAMLLFTISRFLLLSSCSLLASCSLLS